ncbi:MAG: hypothetical protein Q4G26_14720 [Paracoccus sp. (in: a-proteobacteria)]|nr:hypothetical protein [Paracoccus sp. (in: a-proteobacteria)]
MSRFTVQGSGQHWAVMDGGKVVKTFGKPFPAEAYADDLARRARYKRRPCLTCGTEFVSQGPHHRMCGRCRIAAQETFQGAV